MYFKISKIDKVISILYRELTGYFICICILQMLSYLFMFIIGAYMIRLYRNQKKPNQIKRIIKANNITRGLSAYIARWLLELWQIL